MSTDTSPAAADAHAEPAHEEGHGGGHGGTKAIIAALLANRSAACVAQAIDEAEGRIRAAVPIARVVYLEPDLRRAPAPARSGATTAARD